MTLSGTQSSERSSPTFPSARTSAAVSIPVSSSHLPDSDHQTADLHTFSAGFGDPRHDELSHAEHVSRVLGTIHHPVTVTADDFAASWRELTWHRDAPLSEPADVAVARLARTASHDVKVVLSGEGSDELFAGYPKYRAANLVDRLSHIPPQLRIPVLQTLSPRLPAQARRLRVVMDAAAASPDSERFRAWFAPLSAEVRRNLTGRSSRPPVPYAGRPLDGDLLRQMSVFDTGAWLSDNLLERGDRMTMSASVELRPPFLDADVVDLAFRLPSSLKLHRGTGKWLVKQVARGLIPDEIIDRPKSGFKVPLDEWFRHGLRDMAHEMLLSTNSFCADVFDRSAVRALLDSHVAGKRDEAIGIWTLLSLEVWHEVHLDQLRSASTT